MKTFILFILSGIILLTGCSDSPGPGNNREPVNNNCDYVDLGLPSGNLWSFANIIPIPYAMHDDFCAECMAKIRGNRYAWGELDKKDNYTPQNYYLYDFSSGKMLDQIESNICNTAFDVASQYWSGDWQMPTRKDFEELLEYCTFELEVFSPGAEGLCVRGPNGHCIFIWLRECETGDRRFIAQLWSGESVEEGSLYAYALEIDENGVRIASDIPKYEGCYVRPVMKPKR